MRCGRVRWQHRLGKVHRARHVAVLEELAHVVGDHHGAVLLGLDGRRAEVREADHFRMIEQRALREVGDVRAQLARVERGNDGRGVDDLVAREVQQHRAAAHRLQARGVHELVGLFGERHVHGHDVGAREQVVEVHGLLDARRKLPGTLHGDRGVVAEHLHAQLERGVCDLDADRAEADDAERALRQLEADELLLAGLDGLVELLARALQRARVMPKPGANCAPP